MRLNVTLKIRNEADLDTLLAAQDNPTSVQYHHYLSTQEFNILFAPTQDTVDLVSTYLQNRGGHITSVTPNHLLVNVVSTVATVEQAFAIQINNYQLKTRVAYAPNTDPLIPNMMMDSIQTDDRWVE